MSSSGIDFGSLLTSAVDDISGNISSSIGLSTEAGLQKEGLQIERDKLGLDRDKFDLMELLSMQDYRDKESKRKWEADFRRYLSQGYGVQ